MEEKALTLGQLADRLNQEIEDFPYARNLKILEIHPKSNLNQEVKMIFIKVASPADQYTAKMIIP